MIKKAQTTATAHVGVSLSEAAGVDDDDDGPAIAVELLDGRMRRI